MLMHILKIKSPYLYLAIGLGTIRIKYFLISCLSLVPPFKSASIDKDLNIKRIKSAEQKQKQNIIYFNRYLFILLSIFLKTFFFYKVFNFKRHWL